MTLTAAQIVSRLRKRFEPPEWVLMEEFHNATGANSTHRFDALAFNVWPSRGMIRVGLEVKVSRSDFARELANHDKRAAIERHCHEVYFAVAKGVCEPREVPEPWGLLVEHGDTLKCAVKPKFRDVGPMDPGLGLVAIRRLHEQLAQQHQRHYIFEGEQVTQEQIDALVAKQYEVREQRFREQVARMDEERAELTRQSNTVERWKDIWKRLRVRAGEQAWRMVIDEPPGPEEIERVIKALRARELGDLEETLRRAHSRLADIPRALGELVVILGLLVADLRVPSSPLSTPRSGPPTTSRPGQDERPAARLRGLVPRRPRPPRHHPRDQDVLGADRLHQHLQARRARPVLQPRPRPPRQRGRARRAGVLDGDRARHMMLSTRRAIGQIGNGADVARRVCLVARWTTTT